MKISRITATRIMSKAMQARNSCLLGLLGPTESIDMFCDVSEMEQAMPHHKSAAIFYNQHPDAIQFVESHTLSEGQINIEIFQDIEGVFGLRAYQMIDRMLQPVEISFYDSANPHNA
jgi:hypothetical protein